MATDNRTQGGTDIIRDLARQGGTVKTQAFQIDAGGASANAEILITAGQQTMAASLPVVLASNHTTLITRTTPAVTQWGQALAVVAGATATLASIASSVAGYQINGIVANGLGDGYFFVQVASATVISGRIRSTAPVFTLLLPNGINVPTGSLVALKVTNESGSTTDFEATLLGT